MVGFVDTRCIASLHNANKNILMDKFQNRYRIPSTRLQKWNYGSAGFYFITVCTRNREHYFGEILNGETILNELGCFVQSEWTKSTEIRPGYKFRIGRICGDANGRNTHQQIRSPIKKFRIYYAGF